jgi:cytochrome c
MLRRRSVLLALAFLLLSCSGRQNTSAAGPLRVFVYTATAGFRHDSIPAAQTALRALDPALFSLEFGEDPAELTRALAHSDVVAFVLTSGDLLDETQQDEFEAFVRGGGGFVGVHSASDSEYDWPFYAQLIGAHFADHPSIQRARVLREAASHPSVRFLPEVWQRTDEWYNFQQNPRPEVEVLLRLDEASYLGGSHGSDHPIAWCRSLDGGRTLYTALGHTEESWTDPLFVRHVSEALLWAGQRPPSEGPP